MHISQLTFAVSLLTTLASAQDAPSDSYAPTYVHCPSDLQIRPASDGLSPEEQAWRKLRLPNVVESLPAYLQAASIPGLSIDQYMAKLNASNVPITGLAVSGGGSQSGFGGLGMWQALDARYPPAQKAGTGGFVQTLTYMTGLSGGGLYFVAPLAANNFSSVADLRLDSDMNTNYLTGPTGNVSEWYGAAFERTYAKFAAGFTVSVTDVFGQLFRQFLPVSWRSKTYSDIAAAGTAFSRGAGPMPIVLYSEVVPGSSPEIGKIMYPGTGANLTIYEQTPFEMGSWIGGRVQAFVPTRFLGTSMSNGKAVNSSMCVTGFDQLSLTQSTTGNAWNFWLIADFYNVGLFVKRSIFGRQAPANDIPIPAAQYSNMEVQLVNETATTFHQTFNQSLWSTVPNPFNNYAPSMNGVKNLLLVDGSEVGEVLPIRPLIIPERKVDFMVVYDSSGEDPVNDWVNGTTLALSSTHAKAHNLPFPIIPDSATFVNLKLNRYPTFFGCNASAETPLVLYVPNAPWSNYGNYSFMQAEFTNHQLDLVFNNSFNAVTFGGGQLDPATGSAMSNATGRKNVPHLPPFPACIACGAIAKSLARVNEPLPKACQACFDVHCWNGETKDTPANPTYNPTPAMEPGLTYEEWNSTDWYGSGSVN